MFTVLARHEHALAQARHERHRLPRRQVLVHLRPTHLPHPAQPSAPKP